MRWHCSNTPVDMSLGRMATPVTTVSDCAAGALIPVAYGPGGESSSETILYVMDMLVCEPVKQGSTLYFRFFPQADGYRSGFGTTLGFVLTSGLFPDSFVRLVADTGEGTASLQVRPSGSSTWTPAAATTPLPAIGNTSSCYVYFYRRPCGASCSACKHSPRQSCQCKELPVTAVGFDITDGSGAPILPPVTVVPPQFAFSIPVTSAQVAAGCFGYFGGLDVSVRESWRQAWMTVRPSDAWIIVSGSGSIGTGPYDSAVIPVEDALFIKLVPGQLQAAAFRPYSTSTPAFGGQLALVPTATIPALTTMYLWGNDWGGVSPPPVGTAYWFKWTSPATDIPPGATITFSGLGGTLLPVATAGSVVTGAAAQPSSDIIALTAFTPDVTAVTGVYTAPYTGSFPTDLVPGQSMHTGMWPAAASLISLAPCRIVTDWATQKAAINRAPFAAWFNQPVPTFTRVMPCGDGVTASGCGSGGTVLYSGKLLGASCVRCTIPNMLSG